jgi:fused signal recognition particle receptor
VLTLHLLMLIAVALQLPLGALAFAVEASQRKKRPRPAPEPLPARRREATRPAAERPAITPPQPSPPPQPPFAPQEVSPRAETEPVPRIEAEPPPRPVEQPRAELPPQPPAREEAAEAPEIPPAQPEPAPPEVVSEPVLQPPPVPQARPEEARKQPIRIGLALRKTRDNFLGRVRAAITGSARVDEIYEGLEEALISADVGVETSMKLVEAVRSKLKNDARADVITETLKEEITRTLIAIDRPINSSSPLVIMMSGVNGAGKTTTVAKLAALLKSDGAIVIVAAADTFRAAAIEQLQVWCDRVGVELIKQKQGADPAAVAFDAVRAAKARNASAVVIDTAGRLQTKVNLMEELKKIARVVSRELPGAPHENWLVLDATTGQNALSQAKTFGEAIKLSGVILAKLDSTAKGGVIVAIAERLKLPVRYVGLGEGLEDLRPFDPREFVEALFSETEKDQAAASGTYAA